MKKIESKIGTIQQPSEKIFNYLSDFKNFEHLIPQDKISNWKAGEDQCEFNVPGVGEATMKIIEKEPNKLIKISGDANQGAYHFYLWSQLKEVEESVTKMKLTIQADLNPMLEMMAKKPLKNFVDLLIDQMQAFSFEN
jgi:carbon monoxide dehydrogenase subunit G